MEGPQVIGGEHLRDSGTWPLLLVLLPDDSRDWRSL
jgi:hypothetical protein